ncbi:hypothetical protein [Streptomyces tremellae]|uniref:PknH-like extracellular domain-containing protein n=1 Tax=Streptomyces tremellae TaxID=1124239 RepID=A0ABP7F0W8_9ACTN
MSIEAQGSGAPRPSAPVPPRPAAGPRAVPGRPAAPAASSAYTLAPPVQPPALPPLPPLPPHGTYPPRPAPAAGPPRRTRRTALTVALLVLGLGLVGGAVTGSWLLDQDPAHAAAGRFDTARQLWHTTPVDTLFPPVVDGTGAGPDGADRTWTRLGVAPDSGCAATLGPDLAAALRTAGCLRVVRATYRDATSSDVTTVGLVFTRADPAGTAALRTAFTKRRLAADPRLLPAAYAVPGTAAASFGGRQRASWSIDVLAQAPVVAYAVTGFADGRAVAAPEPAAAAMAAHDTSPAGQAGLGYEAKGLADRVGRTVRALAAPSPTEGG